MSATEGKITVACESCSAKLRVPASAAGKLGTCPKCGGKFQVPSVPPAPSAASDEPDDSWLDQAGGGEPVAAPPPVPGGAALRPCPGCSGPLSAAAVVCTKCGYDTRRGGVTGMAPTALGDGAKAATAMLMGRGLVLGIVCSALGAAIGGGIWFGVVYSTQYEIGWIAWGVGVLAGLGMMLGGRDHSALHGGIAAGLSALAIVAAKYAAVMALLSGPSDLFEGQTDVDIVSEGLAGEVFDGRSDVEEMSEEEYDKAWEQEVARQRVEAQKLKPAEVAERAGAYRQQAEKQFEAFRGALQGAAFRSSFAWLDIVFFLLAIVTAFRLGSGSAQVSQT